MAKIEIEKKVSLPPDDAFRRIQELLQSDPDLRKMDADYRCEFNPSQLTGKAKGQKFEATIKVVDKDQSSVIFVTVTLPFLLTPFKGSIESILQKKMERLYT